MRTRKVKLYIDLQPAWQDMMDKGDQYATLHASDRPYGLPMEGYRRYAITVELPEFGGTVEAIGNLPSTTEIVKTGSQDENT